MQDSNGKDRIGQDRTGQERTEQSRRQQDKSGQEWTGMEWIGLERTLIIIILTKWQTEPEKKTKWHIQQQQQRRFMEGYSLEKEH